MQSGSPSTAMGKGGGVDQSAKKKARLEPPPNVQVKQEIIPHQATTGAGGGGGAMVAAEQRSRSRVDVLVSMDMSVLHCRICSHPYKPPVFRCKGGHMACGSCLARIPDKQCRKCEHGGSAFERCPALEEVVSSALIECAHDGCSSYVTYHEAGEHQSVCPHAPCSCPEPGCFFQAGGLKGREQMGQWSTLTSIIFTVTSTRDPPVPEPASAATIAPPPSCTTISCFTSPMGGGSSLGFFMAL